VPPASTGTMPGWRLAGRRSPGAWMRPLPERRERRAHPGATGAAGRQPRWGGAVSLSWALAENRGVFGRREGRTPGSDPESWPRCRAGLRGQAGRRWARGSSLGFRTLHRYGRPRPQDFPGGWRIRELGFSPLPDVAVPAFPIRSVRHLVACASTCQEAASWIPHAGSANLAFDPGRGGATGTRGRADGGPGRSVAHLRPRSAAGAALAPPLATISGAPPPRTGSAPPSRSA